MEDRYNCKNCGANISEKQMLDSEFFCPFCKKKVGWFSDPVFVGDWNEEEKEE